MIRLALRSALSDRALENRVLVVESWGWDEPSTKQALGALADLSVDGRVLVVLQRDDEAIWKSFRNLPAVQIIDVAELNAYDVLVNDWVVFTTATLPSGNPAGADAEEAE
jgi:large subunit ribosomal protein L4